MVVLSCVLGHPVVLIALSLDRARTFVEHGFQYIFSNQSWDSFKQAPQSTVDIDTNPVERFLFAPFGFAYHQRIIPISQCRSTIFRSSLACSKKGTLPTIVACMAPI
jgi:hypothetical protein